MLGDKRLASPGLSATAGVGDMKHWPKTYEEMHPGAYNAKARLQYMDQLGIWVMVLYPNVGGFGSQQFPEHRMIGMAPTVVANHTLDVSRHRVKVAD